MVRIGPSMNIEMRHLRYFVAVAEEASFTAAAQRVHVTQLVLSTQIRAAGRRGRL
jgi:DNA-binding transcriptional LysR family regulator